MARRKIMFGIGAGVISTAVDGLAGLVNIHFLRHYLPESVSGYWFLALTAGGFLMLAQSALTPAVARFTAQQSGGRGIPIGGLATVRRLTRWLMMLLLVAAVGAFMVYLRPVARAANLGTGAGASWFAYALGVVAALDASARFAMLNGLGEVGWDKVTRIVISSLGVLLTWLSLKYGLGLPGLGISFLLQSAVMLGFAEFLLVGKGEQQPGPATVADGFWRRLMPTLSNTGCVARADTNGRQLVVETAKLLGLALIGYLVMNSGIFVVERRFGPDVVSKYSPLTRVGMLLATVASLIPQTVYPYVARAWATRSYRSHRRLFLGGVGLSIAGYVIAALVVWLLAPVLMPLWLGPGGYLGPDLLGLVLLMYGLLVSNVAFSTPVLASVGNAFIAPSLLNLILVLILIWPFSGRWGLNGVPAAMFAGSLLPAIWVGYRSWQLMLHHNQNQFVADGSR